MNKLKIYSILLLSSILSMCTHAQTIYVDAVKGVTDGDGTISNPLSSLEKAISMADGFIAKEPINIKLAPGLYVVSHELTIRTSADTNSTSKFTIEAVHMPDDNDWKPADMPVIQSISPNNSNVQFTHSVCLLVAKNNVSIKGIKFVGNASPEVAYYYPITRENENLNGLEVSQCFFIGERNSMRLQSGLWTHGAGIHVDRCIFYNCRCGMVLIKGIKDLSITNSIIYGAYETAIWFGKSTDPFVFSNNIVSHCNFVWVRPKDANPVYTFRNSLITENKEYMGYIANDLVPAPDGNVKEISIKKTGTVKLLEIETQKFQPHDYLNPVPGSDGSEFHAGIFKK